MKTISEDTKKNPVGRPTKYRPEFIQLALEFIASGKSITQLSRELQVAKAQIYVWAKKYPDFQDALDTGKDWGQVVWEDKLEDMMLDKGVNAPLVKLYFANRVNWHDKQEDRGEDSAPPPVSYTFEVKGPVDDVKITNAKS